MSLSCMNSMGMNASEITSCSWVVSCRIRWRRSIRALWNKAAPFICFSNLVRNNCWTVVMPPQSRRSLTVGCDIFWQVGHCEIELGPYPLIKHVEKTSATSLGKGSFIVKTNSNRRSCSRWKQLHYVLMFSEFKAGIIVQPNERYCPHI